MKLSLVLGFGLLVLALAALLVGAAPIGIFDLIPHLFADPDHDAYALILREIRLPRILLALMVGASLGLSGAALQGLLRNPLADPGVIGVSASAGLGAVLALYYGFAAWSAYALPGMAMLGALISIALLQLLATRDASVLGLILAGVAINASAGALTALAMNLSPTPFALSDMVLWLMGSLANRGFNDVMLALPFMLVGWLLLLLAAPMLSLLSLGEGVAQTLGINLARLRGLVVVGVALSVGAGVAVAGMIGFVGLVVPHMLRPFTDHSPGRLLLPSALGGALLLLAADLLVRWLDIGQELKLGVVTALLGAPFFLALILKTRRQMR